jgi:hypothetical protein
MIFELSENEFVVIGTMIKVQFFSKPGKNTHVDLLRFEEGEFVNGEWKAGRVLNGDEKMMIQLKDMPSTFKIQVYEY